MKRGERTLLLGVGAQARRLCYVVSFGSGCTGETPVLRRFALSLYAQCDDAQCPTSGERETHPTSYKSENKEKRL
jgi:hypothetical protein